LWIFVVVAIWLLTRHHRNEKGVSEKEKEKEIGLQYMATAIEIPKMGNILPTTDHENPQRG
jgi:hypothetical protein